MYSVPWTVIPTVGLVGLGMGAVAGHREIEDSDDSDERYGVTAARAVEGGVLATSVAGVGYGLAKSSFRSTPNGFFETAGPLKAMTNRGGSYFRNLGMDAQRTLQAKNGMSALSFLSRRWGLATAVGAGVGYMSGDDDTKLRNTAIGAGVAGLGAGVAGKMAHRWKSTGAFGKGIIKYGGIPALTLLGGAAIAARQQSPGESISYAEGDDSEGYDYSNEPLIDRGVSRRMQRINATGDIVLGLHNKRHG